MRAIMAAVLLLVGCSSDPTCLGGTLQILPARDGEDFRYQYFECDGVTPRLICVRASGSSAAKCEGDASPVCCV